VSATTIERLVAYHGSEELKTRIMGQIRAHREADEIAQRVWMRGMRGMRL
jgi:hypothetical protein